MLRQRFCRHRPQPEILLQIFDRADSVEEVGSISSRYLKHLLLTRRAFTTGGQELTVWTAAVDKEPLGTFDELRRHPLTRAKSPTISTAALAHRTHILALYNLAIVATYSVSDAL